MVLTIGIELTPAEAAVSDARCWGVITSIPPERNRLLRIGAHNRNRTDDLFLTKEVLYRLSYVSETRYCCCFDDACLTVGAGDGNRTHVSSLEGYSSTIELHPPALPKL